MIFFMYTFFFFQIAPLVIESLEYDNKDLLQVMVDLLCYFVQEKDDSVASSLQTILPRLVNLTKYTHVMVSWKNANVLL